jgi:hypothetical protein
MRSFPRPATGLLAAVALGMSGACSDARLSQVREDTDKYIRGIQYEDARSLVKHMGAFRAAAEGAAPEDWPELERQYEARARERFAEYEEAKATEVLPLDEDGITLLKALAIGKGVYYAFEEVHVEGEREALGTMVVNIDYSSHRFDAFPRGTRIFFMGDPLGTLRTVTVGEPGPGVRVISRIRLEWRLVWFPGRDVYPAGWSVESIRARAGSVEFLHLPAPVGAGGEPGA